MGSFEVLEGMDPLMKSVVIVTSKRHCLSRNRVV
jgi:hypothetical protein